MPEPGWLAAYHEAFELDPRVGAAFGPHLPHPDTSPMIARELIEFFGGFSPDGGPALQRAGGLTLPLQRERLLLAASAGRRSASPTSPTARTRRSAGRCSRPAGSRSSTRALPCATPTTTGRSSSCSATSTSTAGCARPAATWSRCGCALRSARSAPTLAGSMSRARRPGARPLARAVGGAPGRAASGRRARVARRAPAGRVQRALSLEGRGGAAGEQDGLPQGMAIAPSTNPYRDMLRVTREGAAPLDEPVPGMAERPIHLATVIPPSSGEAAATARSSPFSTDSSAWATPALSGCTTLTSGMPRGPRRSAVASSTSSFRCRRPLHIGFGDWNGADVVLATGWDTVYPVAAAPALPGTRVPDPGPRAGLLRGLRRGALGGGDLRAGSVRDQREQMASRSGRAPLRPARHVVPAGGRRRGLPAARRGAPPRHRRLLRARGHTPARHPARRARARGAQAPPSGRADRAVRASRAAAALVRV